MDIAHFTCPITGIEIDGSLIKHSSSGKFYVFYYPIDAGNDPYYLTFCKSFFERDILPENQSILRELAKIRPLLIEKIIQNIPIGVMHWNCENAIGEKGSILLKDLLPELEKRTDIPKNRKQKADNILLHLSNLQNQEGDFVKINGGIQIWGKLYMSNHQEFLFYLSELHKKNLIRFDLPSGTAQLTFEGLDYIDNLKEINKNIENNFLSPQYDIALSFAGEERSYVEKIADELIANKVTVFYDNYETADLWGKDLYQHLHDIYRNKSRFCIIFISENYAKKLWTRHELKAAQAKAFKENEEYILPIRFDKTSLPGMSETMGYINFKDYTPAQIAAMAIKKLKK